jgi:hypothetical protein
VPLVASEAFVAEPDDVQADAGGVGAVDASEDEAPIVGRLVARDVGPV